MCAMSHQQVTGTIYHTPVQKAPMTDDTQCSGGIPCSSCQKKRQKPRCYYKSTFSKDSEDGEVGNRHHTGLLFN